MQCLLQLLSIESIYLKVTYGLVTSSQIGTEAHHTHMEKVILNNKLSSKILTIGCRYNPPYGGIAQVLWNYDKYIFENFKFVENSRKSNGFINSFIAIRAVIKIVYMLLADREIKIVHIHSASGVSFLRSTVFLKIAKVLKKKVVMHIHGGGFADYYKGHCNFVTKNLKHCDKIITLSQNWVDFYTSIGFHSSCVENVIAEPVLRNVHHDDALHMLYLGLIIERKGIFDLLDVLNEHKSEFSGKLMLHIGGNGEVEKLNKIISDKDLQDIVSFEGWVDNEKKEELLNLCDVFILPSYVEGLPLSILEAMAYNMAIISTNVGGIPSLVIDKKNGFLFEPGDKTSIYSLIKTVVFDKQLLAKMGKDNGRMIEDYYPRSVANKLSEIYNSLF